MRNNEQVKQQMFSNIAQWQQSGLSQKQFCLQNSIAYHIFHYWYKRYRSEKGASSGNTTPCFIPLQVASSAAAVELLLSDGKRILFHQSVSSDYLKAIIS